jgi:hypothetical protein
MSIVLSSSWDEQRMSMDGGGLWMDGVLIERLWRSLGREIATSKV